MLSHWYIKRLSILSFTVLAFLVYAYGISYFWMLLLTVLFVGITTWGSFDIRSNYFGKVHYKAAQHGLQAVALTFDDGPSPHTTTILDLLRQHQVHATFFCIGKNLIEHPDIAQRIVDEGHCIANHSFNHSPNMGFYSTKTIVEELKATDREIEKLTGTPAIHYRPPYGITNPNTAKACGLLHKEIIGWSIRSLDTVIASPSAILSRIMRRLKPGSIILLHDTSEKTISVVDRLLPILVEQRLNAVTINELLNKNKR